MATVITLKRGQVTYTVPVGTYTVENIATMFRLLPQRSWLREGAFGNNRVYFPVEGQFDLSTVGELSDVEVEGIPMPPPPPPLPGAVTPPPSSATTPRNYPGFTPVIAGNGRRLSFTLTIVKAEIESRARSGKPNFNPVDNVLVELTEAMSNVLHVNALVKRELGDEYVVVSTEGYPVKDCTATQGKLIFSTVNYSLLIL